MKKINAGNFKPYGWVIEYPNKTKAVKSKNLFHIVLKEARKTGWRIAYLVVRDKVIEKLEQHPDSFESFEPVCGKTIIFVATPRSPGKIESFLLNRPVILKKGIWHAVITKGKESEIKITENAGVKCNFLV